MLPQTDADFDQRILTILHFDPSSCCATDLSLLSQNSAASASCCSHPHRAPLSHHTNPYDPYITLLQARSQPLAQILLPCYVIFMTATHLRCTPADSRRSGCSTTPLSRTFTCTSFDFGALRTGPPPVDARITQHHHRDAPHQSHRGDTLQRRRSQRRYLLQDWFTALKFLAGHTSLG